MASSLSEFTTWGVVAESSYGAGWPASAKNLVNVTDLQMARNRGNAVPAIYTGSRRTFAQQVLDQDGTLTVPTNLQYENMLLLHECLMASSRSALVTETQSDISAASGVLTSAALANFGSFSVGDFVYLSGAGISPNTAGVYGPVLAKTTLTITLPTAQVQNFSSGSAVTISTRRLRDGVTPTSLAWEANLAGLTNEFILGNGYDVASMTWAWNRDGANYATEQASLIGQEWTHEDATAATGADVAAPTTGYMSAVAPALGGVGKLWLADGTAALGAVTSLIVTNITINWQNAEQMVKSIGSSGPSAIDKGGLDGSTLTARVRFDDTARTAVAELIEANTTMQAAIACRDLQGNYMVWFIPAAKPSGDIEFGARGSVVYQPLTLTTHDPARDIDSTYYTAGAGIGFQHQLTYLAAP